jgi:hypothetical protein
MTLFLKSILLFLKSIFSDMKSLAFEQRTCHIEDIDHVQVCICVSSNYGPCNCFWSFALVVVASHILSDILSFMIDKYDR